MPQRIRGLDDGPGEDEREPLLALNNAHSEDLSYLTPERFRHLVSEAFLAARIGSADALLIAFDQDARYDGTNFLWFRQRFERFVYVDRVVVAPAARGRGLARSLYGALFEKARHAGHVTVTAEINAIPPNPGSDAFHAALGFISVGSAAVSPDKTVRYVMRDLGDGDGAARRSFAINLENKKC